MDSSQTDGAATHRVIAGIDRQALNCDVRGIDHADHSLSRQVPGIGHRCRLQQDPLSPVCTQTAQRDRLSDDDLLRIQGRTDVDFVAGGSRGHSRADRPGLVAERRAPADALGLCKEPGGV